MKRSRKWRLGSRTLVADHFQMCFYHSWFTAPVSDGGGGDAASVLVSVELHGCPLIVSSSCL